MLLKYMYDSALAHASYFVGCQQTGEALVIDPDRAIGPYLDLARREGMRITAVAETHIHADYVSGSRELAAQTGATLYLSDEGGEAWRYAFADDDSSRLLKDGDRFSIGNVHLDVMHTPGHTPESVSFILTDGGGGAEEPMGIFTGDFVFVGAVGRPDLLERAVGATGSARESARNMFRSLQQFKKLPEFLQVWPAHGAGSACGKGLGAVPSSTVGYELRFNPGLKFSDEEAFVDYLLEDQPEVPPYFKEMKRVNREGPALIFGQPLPGSLPASELPNVVDEGAMVVDVRARGAFSAAHTPGTINIPLGQLATWGGWLLPYGAPYYLIVDEDAIERAIDVVHEIGADTLAGTFDAEDVATEGLNTESYRTAGVSELADAILANEVLLVDVRSDTEWDDGHLPNAHHHFLGTLREATRDLPTNGKPLVVQCRSGARSAIGASILKAAGAEDVINLEGGFSAWKGAGMPISED